MAAARRSSNPLSPERICFRRLTASLDQEGRDEDFGLAEGQLEHILRTYAGPPGHAVARFRISSADEAEASEADFGLSDQQLRGLCSRAATAEGADWAVLAERAAGAQDVPGDDAEEADFSNGAADGAVAAAAAKPAEPQVAKANEAAELVEPAKPAQPAWASDSVAMVGPAKVDGVVGAVGNDSSSVQPPESAVQGGLPGFAQCRLCQHPVFLLLARQLAACCKAICQPSGRGGR